MHKKILLLSVSAGAGHTRAAEAIRACAQSDGLPVSVTHLDAMDYVPAAFRQLYTDWYLKLVAGFPGVWRYMYQAADRQLPDSRWQQLRRAIEHLCTRALRKEIAALQPDAIVCTHFLPAEMLSRLAAESGMACPFWVQVTDFGLHRMWVHEHASGYFVAGDESAMRLREHGVATDKIHVTGIPVMPAFRAGLPRAACAAQFGLEPSRATVLLMGGGAGMGGLDAVADSLLAAGGDYQLIVLAGKNAGALASLRAMSARYPGRLLAFGYSNQVAQLMACADLAITKPGGLTSAECLAMGLPMIVHDPIPGQEECNADYLMEHGVALKALDRIALLHRVSQLLADPNRLAAMRAHARRLARPQAAGRVLQTVLDYETPAAAATALLPSYGFAPDPLAVAHAVS